MRRRVVEKLSGFTGPKLGSRHELSLNFGCDLSPRTYIFSTHVLQFPGQQEETGSILTYRLDSLDSNV